MLSTSHTLLQRLRRLEPTAWERLCLLYGPIIYGWFRRGGMQDADASDAAQEVFRSVYSRIGQFQQGKTGGSFRGWLRAIVLNQARLHYRQSAKRAPTAGSAVDDWTEEESSGDETEGVIVRQGLVRRALDLIQADFTDQTWRIFVRIALQNHDIAEVAAELRLTPNAIRQAKFRVIKRLRQELDGLL